MLLGLGELFLAMTGVNHLMASMARTQNDFVFRLRMAVMEILKTEL